MILLKFNIAALMVVLIGFCSVPTFADPPIFGSPQKTITAPPFEKSKLVIHKQNGETIDLDVELALTPAQQARGLMLRPELAQNAGMLFVFKAVTERNFWMKNTLIPLDIIFVTRTGVIHHIHENAIPHDLTRIKSNGPAYAVLEINGGMSQSLGLKPGDKLLHSAFSVVPSK